MADLLSTGISALQAFQRGLDTTGHNIANVNTPGYSRQQVDFGTRPAQRAGSDYVGNGVQVNDVRRLYDQFLTGQLQTSASAQSRLDTFNTLATQLDNSLADENAGLAPALQNFYAAVQGVSADPSDIPARQVLLGQGQALSSRFQSLDQSFRRLDAQVTSEVHDLVPRINSTAKSIATLNQQIVTAKAGAGGAPPNDLLDKRDQLVQGLAKLVGVTTTLQGDGALNVYVGNGQGLVLGSQADALGVSANAYDGSQPEITFGADGAPVTSQISGGRLGGLLDFRSQLLDPSRNALGRNAVALAQSFNAQHRAGVDLSGNAGENFFNVAQPQVLARRGNTGAADIGVRVGDAGALTTSNFTLSYNGSTYTLKQADSGETVSLKGQGTAADPFTAKGLSIVVDGNAAAGDSFLIRPTARAAGGISVALSGPSRVAAAAPIRTAGADSNLGDAAISAGRVTEAGNQNLKQPVTIKFLSGTTYSINGNGIYTYTSGGPITLNGWQANISGAPQAGDSFSIGPNNDGAGDNRNALLLGGLQNQGVVNGGTTSVGDAYGQLVAQVGTVTSQSKLNLDAQTAVQQQAQAAQQSVSGVNLDEEAANLLRYQQSYQAAAKVISVADTLFQSVLGAVRG